MSFIRCQCGSDVVFLTNNVRNDTTAQRSSLPSQIVGAMMKVCRDYLVNAPVPTVLGI